jgi:hypothetical protein
MNVKSSSWLGGLLSAVAAAAAAITAQTCLRRGDQERRPRVV